MKKILILFFFLFSLLSLDAQVLVKIKDLTGVQGVRDNQLLGYGLVVGLNGKGDSERSKLTRDTAANLFETFGIKIEADQIRSRNIAAVIVTATLPSFAGEGSRIDIKVSSVGDARSIENGELLQTGLRAADGQVYAVAQGTVVTAAKDKQDVYARMTVGYIPNGAIVEQATKTDIVTDGKVALVFSDGDFTTVKNAVMAVNVRFGEGTAKAKDRSVMEISIPVEYVSRVTEFISEVGNLEMEPGHTARVVIDRRSGTVVMGGNIQIAPVAISQKSLNVEIYETGSVSCFLDEWNDKRKNENSFVLEEGVDVQSIVDGLNRMGARTEDIISILRAIKVAGALHAELLII